MRIPEKIDVNNAYDCNVKCQVVLSGLREYKDELVLEAIHNSKSMNELDKCIESILYKYYTSGNSVIDYYTKLEELAE